MDVRAPEAVPAALEQALRFSIPSASGNKPFKPAGLYGADRAIRHAFLMGA